MTSAFHVYFGPEALAAPPKVRNIAPHDCLAALAEGFDDFFAMPTYPAFVGLFYAVAGIALVGMSSLRNALHLVFPLAAGFALIGPFVAIGLYEMSRRRDRGLAVTWRDSFALKICPLEPENQTGTEACGCAARRCVSDSVEVIAGDAPGKKRRDGNIQSSAERVRQGAFGHRRGSATV